MAGRLHPSLTPSVGQVQANGGTLPVEDTAAQARVAELEAQLVELQEAAVKQGEDVPAPEGSNDHVAQLEAKVAEVRFSYGVCLSGSLWCVSCIGGGGSKRTMVIPITCHNHPTSRSW